MDCQVGVTADDIGVIAPYQQQVRLIRETLKMVHALDRIEVNTVDQYQGRDKSAIVISFVRTAHTSNTTQVCFPLAEYCVIGSCSAVYGYFER
jgi:superfamily I DNA and/or RNA helicase